MTEVSAEVVIRQSLRSLVHELAMGVLASREEGARKPFFHKQTANLLRSPDFLKALYESPTEHIGKIFNAESEANKTSDNCNGFEYTKEQRGTIVAYLQEVNKLKPAGVRDWNTLRHYLYYIYRQFVTPEPNYVADAIPPPVLKEIRDLIEGLVMEDTTQLFLRLFAQIREFVCLAVQLFLSNLSDIESFKPDNGVEQLYYLMNRLVKVLSVLTNYYSALCSAADLLAPVLPEYNELLMKKYFISWSLLNKSIFYHYFYRTTSVQAILLLFEKVSSRVDTQKDEYAVYLKFKEGMQLLEKNWSSAAQKIVAANELMAENDTTFGDRCNHMFQEHKKILNTNFWLTRTLEQKLIQDRNELGSQIILWVGDKENFADRLLNTKGQCICEECMLVEYGHISPGLKNGKIALKINKKNWDSMTDKIDWDVTLDKSVDTPTEKPNSDVFNKMEPIIKIASEAPATNDIDQLLTAFSKLGSNSEKPIPDVLIKAAELTSPKPTDISKCNTECNAKGIDFKNLKVGRRSSAGDVTRESAHMNMFSHQKTTSKIIINSKVNLEPDNRGVLLFKHDHETHTDDKKPCQNGCDYHKESRKCDCTYCEVFGTSVSVHSHKTNETRDRLRTRLNQRKEKVSRPSTSPYNAKPPTVVGVSKVAVNPFSGLNGTAKKAEPVQQEPLSSITNVQLPEMKKQRSASPKLPDLGSLQRSSSIFSVSTVSLNSYLQEHITDSRDINELLNFIEGNERGGEERRSKKDQLDALAEKKAAKKARQKMKKEEERLRLEEEERRKAEEERLQEELRKAEERRAAEALARQLAEKVRRHNKKNSGKNQTVKEDTKKNKKKGKSEVADDRRHLIEETIPAMVTIKRIVENNNCTPTVTITLKGSTPDQDKLLYTLVNGYNNDNTVENTGDKKKKSKQVDANASKKKQKNMEKPQETTKELKVLLAVDKSSNKPDAKKLKEDKKQAKKLEEKKKNVEDAKKSAPKVMKDADLNIPMLRLPPGITITKVDGPVVNRNKSSNNTQTTQQNVNVPVSKSGVIVVDTEKLIQQSVEREQNKKKKKKNKKGQEQTSNQPDKNKNTPMVTLKNPIFHTLQKSLSNKDKLVPDMPVIPCNQQASIIKNENGMVTIRSPRLQQSLGNGTSVSNLLSELKPVMGPDVSTSYLQACHTSLAENSRISSLNAQEILSGLPGIEITKVDKRATKHDSERKSCQAADVSIIPTTNNCDKFAFDRDDWHYESVFTPKDILEDDLDAEERELEAFKRFCQQSVPPKRKEKVAHLNVKDIIFKKKNDVSYV